MRTTSNQREIIKWAKEATIRFRQAIREIHKDLSAVFNEISQEEFIARRNNNGSKFYRFITVAKGSKPMSKYEIKKALNK